MAPLKCTIKIESSKEEDYGYIVNPDKHIHKLLTDITLRAIGIMMTNRAKTGLLFLAEKWSTKHQLQFNCKEAVKGFQDILTRASNDLSTWPAVIMDWTMPETIDAWYENVRCEDPEILPDSLPFIVEAEYFSLNGLVCD